MELESIREELAALHQESYAWALTCCGGRAAEAEDVLHAVYIKVLAGEATFGGRSSFKTWLFAVVRNTALGLWRKRQRRLTLLRGWFEREAPSDPLSQPTTPRPDEVYHDLERRERIQAALATLSDRQREVLELVFYHDLTIEEASEVLEMKLGTARTHYARGKQRLLRLLSDDPSWALETA